MRERKASGLSDAELEQRAHEVLRAGYHFTVVRDEDGWMGFVQEFPGCFSAADTAQEALSQLLDVAVSWLMSVIDYGQSIPPPAPSHSGEG